MGPCPMSFWRSSSWRVICSRTLATVNASATDRSSATIHHDPAVQGFFMSFAFFAAEHAVGFSGEFGGIWSHTPWNSAAARATSFATPAPFR
jgi:hypothetical protein